MKYLAGYSPELLAKVQTLIDNDKLGARLLSKYGAAHQVRSERALYDYVMEIKAEFMRSSDPLSKVAWDSKLQVVQHALGTHTTVSRVQGGKLKAKREIRIATVFRDAPAEFLKMIVVHELAHLRERDHDKAFYQLCLRMEPDYHQLEFDLRLYLTYLDSHGKLDWGGDRSASADQGSSSSADR